MLGARGDDASGDDAADAIGCHFPIFSMIMIMRNRSYGLGATHTVANVTGAATLYYTYGSGVAMHPETLHYKF